MNKRQLKKCAKRDARQGRLDSQYLRMWLRWRYKRAAKCVTYGSTFLGRLRKADCYAYVGEGVSEHISYLSSGKR